jgi:hypothetical protein
MRWLATVAALWLCGLPGALAQSQDWLILPATTGDQTEWMRPTVDDLGRELRKQGVGVWTPKRASAAFKARGSAPPAKVSERDMKAWVERSRDALRKLVQAQPAAALAELEDAQAFSLGALETLNRDPRRARIVLDTCLYLVRARMESGARQAALTQAQECVRVVPLTEPSRRMHPPEVIALYESAKEPGPEHANTLHVESQPPKCPIRVNGVLVGKTPLDLSNLYPGEYRVQLECGSDEPGRVHRVQVAAGGASLFIFDSFDHAVRSDPVLHLRYEKPPVVQQLAIDARQIARALPASAVVVVSLVGDSVLELRVVTLTQIEPTLARLALRDGALSSEAAEAAVSTLLQGECTDFTGDEPVRIDCISGEPAKQTSIVNPALEKERRGPERPPRGLFVPGVSLASVGAASMLTSYGLLIARRSAGSDWQNAPNDLDTQDKWLHLGTGVIATSSAGAGLLVAAMPLVLPYRPKTPWWAWLSGGFGLAATAGAIASAVTASPKPPQSCKVNGPDPTACVERGRDTDRAIVLGMTAAPLLAMPLVYLLRRGDKKLSLRLKPVWTARRGGGAVGLQGVF